MRIWLPFRAESTVMSGTPVLSTLTAGLAGAVPVGVRGLLNATTNVLCVRAEPVGQVTITGPGAGPELAGQGVLIDLLAVARAVP